jgi:hypothetical protein
MWYDRKNAIRSKRAHKEPQLEDQIVPGNYRLPFAATPNVITRKKKGRMIGLISYFQQVGENAVRGLKNILRPKLHFKIMREVLLESFSEL